MIIQTKRQTIIEKMYKLKGKARTAFGQFLAKEFTDEDLLELSHENADKLLKFLENI